MTLSKFFATMAYVCGAAATIIATGGVAAPAWVAASLTAAAPLFGHLACSPLPAGPNCKVPPPESK
jgi:hypothetical protein